MINGLLNGLLPWVKKIASENAVAKPTPPKLVKKAVAKPKAAPVKKAAKKSSTADELPSKPVTAVSPVKTPVKKPATATPAKTPVKKPAAAVVVTPKATTLATDSSPVVTPKKAPVKRAPKKTLADNGGDDGESSDEDPVLTLKKPVKRAPKKAAVAKDAPVVAPKRTAAKKVSLTPTIERTVSSDVKVIMDPVSRKFVIQGTKFVVDDPESVTVIGTLHGRVMRKLTDKAHADAIAGGFKVVDNANVSAGAVESDDDDSDSETTNILEAHRIVARSTSSQKTVSKAKAPKIEN